MNKLIGKPEVETIGVLLAAFLGQALMNLLGNHLLVDLIVVIPVLLILAWWIPHLLFLKTKHRKTSTIVVELANQDVAFLSGVGAGILAAGVSGFVAYSITVATLAVAGFASAIALGFALVNLLKFTLGLKDN